MKIGDIVKIKLTKGIVEAELLEENESTILVKLLHDNHVIVRRKDRDLVKESERI